MKHMHNDMKNIGIISFVFILAFLGFLLIPSTQQNDISTPNNKRSLITDLDFGTGKDDFISHQDSDLYPSSNEYNSVSINHKLTVLKTNPKGILSIKAKKRIYIGPSGSINYSESASSTEGITIPKNKTTAGSGGSLGGVGGGGECINPKLYDINMGGIDSSVVFGQAGLIGTNRNKGDGGWGGGFILLEAPEIIIDGILSANGGDGIKSGGGGSGGKITILANKITVNGKITATGGNGGSSTLQGAGGGGGGIIVFYVNYTGNGEIDVSGGEGGKALDIYTGCNGQSGASGIIAKP